MNKAKIISFAFLCLICLSAGLFFHWTVNRIYIEPGQSLVLRYKGPLTSMFGLSGKSAKPRHFANEGEVGVIKEMRGPGRHFYCPVWYERTIVKDMIVEPGQIAIVTSKLGEPLPAGKYLVDGDLGETEFKGILRRTFGPGVYRIHPYAYDYKIVDQVSRHLDGKNSGFVDIPTGYVGVVTNKDVNPLTKEPQGVLPKVLPPGLYPINPLEQEVDIVEIGYREATISVELSKDPNGALVKDTAGEPQIANATTGINFPSNDGFPIQMDFTAIWGIFPDAAPNVIKTFGNIKQVENKVILPQIESICRNKGSKHSAVELLVGESRQVFQNETEKEFHVILDNKNINMLYALIRHIYIPQNIREPIQKAFVADEEKLTNDQKQLTAREEANLRDVEKQKEVEVQKIDSDTARQVADLKANGAKKVGETQATGIKLAAAIERETAEVNAQASVLLGQAKAESEKLRQEAIGQLFELAVKAFGTAGAYNRWVFAKNMPDNVELNFMYAGEGTLWTNINNVGFQAIKNIDDKKPVAPVAAETTK